jgi:hypothetical protein
MFPLDQFRRPCPRRGVPWAFSDAAGVVGGLVIHFDVSLGAESTMMMDHDIHTRKPMTAPSEP